MFKLFICILFTPLMSFGSFKKVELAFKHAEQLSKSSRYEEALLEFQDIEKEFPYSRFSKISKLKIADVYFDMANYVQAQYQYQYYFDLYPKEIHSDYALYRVGLSMYKLLPKTIDRDLTGTTSILSVWRNLLVKFPRSKFTPEILKYQKELLKNLGKKELYIANFYLKQKKYVSAQKRLNGLFKEFPSFKKNKKAIESALACAKGLDDKPAVKKYLDLLKKAN